MLAGCLWRALEEGKAALQCIQSSTHSVHGPYDPKPPSPDSRGLPHARCVLVQDTAGAKALHVSFDSFSCGLEGISED